MTSPTVVIPISPIPSHPETHILDETIRSVRHHLPDSELVLCFDGVRPEQQHMKADYDEAVRRTLWTADRLWKGCVPFVFTEHLHQVGMMRAVIDEIKTPMLMYVEHDMPLRVDREIDLDAVTAFIRDGHSDLVRFYLRDAIPDEHQYLMHGFDGPFLRTSQWSQNVHIATVELYRRVLSQFSPKARTFIEDGIYGKVANHPADWRLHIYHPEGDISCLRHLDGRAGESKYEDRLVF